MLKAIDLILTVIGKQEFCKESAKVVESIISTSNNSFHINVAIATLFEYMVYDFDGELIEINLNLNLNYFDFYKCSFFHGRFKGCTTGDVEFVYASDIKRAKNGISRLECDHRSFNKISSSNQPEAIRINCPENA